MTSPDFFISSAGNFGPLSQPRSCRVKARLRDPWRDDYMLVELDPMLIGQSFGLGDRDISQLILSTRYVGYTLFPITEWPSHVYVTRILDETILQTHSFTKEQVELIAWAMIFQTFEEAEFHFRKFNGHPDVQKSVFRLALLILREVTREREGQAAPWFSQWGGGTQYQTFNTVGTLIDNGYLR